jgi:flagellar protein FliO/FliZ
VCVPRPVPKWDIKCRPKFPVTMLDSAMTWLTAAAALGGIVGLILLIGRVLRYTPFIRPTASGRLLIVKDTIALDARRRLHLIQHGDRSVLLLTGGETDLVVGWLDGPGT